MTVKRYEVIGSQPVLGDRNPGDKFDDDLDEGIERFLLGIGAIKIISTDVAHDKRIRPESKPAPKSGKKKS